MAAKRYLIVNADDFGQSAGVNRGIIEAHERGIVTSASLMVRWPAATEAAAYARDHPELSLGLHLDLGEWAYRDGEWIALYQVVCEDVREAVAHEVTRQLMAFRYGSATRACGTPATSTANRQKATPTRRASRSSRWSIGLAHSTRASQSW